jgi:integrase
MALAKRDGEWWVDIRVAGRRYRKKCVGAQRREAAEVEAKLILDRQAQAARSGTMPLKARFGTLSEFAATWLDLYARQRNKPSEQRNKRRYLRRDILPLLGHLKPEAITTTHVEQLVTAKRAQGLAPKSVNNILMTLSKLLRSAEEWGVIARAPKVRLLKAPAPNFDFLEPFESARLLRAAPSGSWRTMILLALRTGLRISELVALTWENIDLPRRVLHVRQALVLGVLGLPKSNKERHVAMSQDAVDALLALGPGTGWVFPRLDGRSVDDSVARRILYKTCEVAGLRRIGWHVLRHTFASQLVGMNAPLRNVQEMLGHASLEMTMKYSHVSAHALHATAAMLDRLEERELRIVPRVGHQSGHLKALPAPKSEGLPPSSPRT